MTATALPYIPAKDCAAQIRKDLKEKWPSVKFNVNTRHGNSVSIEWTDGPNRFEVEGLTEAYVGSTWDSSQDLSVSREIRWNGQPARSHLNHVSLTRNFSEAFMRRVLKRWENHDGFEDIQLRVSPTRTWLELTTYTSAAHNLERWILDDLHRSSALVPEVSQPLSLQELTTLAARLDVEAQKLQPKIDRLSIPAFDGLALTPRRARFRTAKREERDRERRIQNLLFALATAARAGTLPPVLQRVTKPRHVRELLRPIIHDESGYQSILTYEKLDTTLLNTLGIEARNWDEATLAIRELDTGDTGAAARAQAEKEQALLGSRIPGFFPTPLPLIEQMLHEAQILDNHTVLEPSAGRGDIADEIRKQHPDAHLTCVEINLTLAEILQHKGHRVEVGDFLQHSARYDRIVMNPPFERGQDMQHIQHAHTLLAPAGVLVAICSEGPFGRQDRQSVQFRSWLKDVHATVMELPEGSFTGRDAFRQTGVRVRMVVIGH